jgi:hypothetical protein
MNEQKLEEINKLSIGMIKLEDYFVIKDILNGKKNLGEYKNFKKKLKIHYNRKLYEAIGDYLTSMVLCSPEERNIEIHVNLVDGGFIMVDRK